MQTVFTIILTFSLLSLQAQATKTNHVTSNQQKEFNNQGEQEDYWAQQFIKDNYVKQTYNKYKGNILVSGDTIKYSNQIFIVFDTESDLRAILQQGLFYPTIITGQENADTLRISNLEEIPFANKGTTHKRYQFWLYRQGLLNPTVCFFELTNENSTAQTNDKAFIDGAMLTFYKQGWIII